MSGDVSVSYVYVPALPSDLPPLRVAEGKIVVDTAIALTPAELIVLDAHFAARGYRRE